MPRGPFSLAAARDFAGGFPAGVGGGGATGTGLAMAFPLEPRVAGGAWAHSALAELRQDHPDATVSALVVSTCDPDEVLAQAARAVSLDAATGPAGRTSDAGIS